MQTPTPIERITEYINCDDLPESTIDTLKELRARITQDISNSNASAGYAESGERKRVIKNWQMEIYFWRKHYKRTLKENRELKDALWQERKYFQDMRKWYMRKAQSKIFMFLQLWKQDRFSA